MQVIDSRFPLRPRSRWLCLTICAGFLLPGCGKPSAESRTDSFPILTPPAPSRPRINGPRVFGVRPGSPFRYRIPATGQRPIKFSARNLPAGLSIDPQSGLIVGKLAEPARYLVRLSARNRFGSDEKDFTIVVGDQIALTPPMGWNSWNCWGLKVSEAKVRAAARALVASGLRDHGWSYVNIDDGWQGERGGPFYAIQPNPKFPNLPALTNEIHSLGLKVGIYSSPWRITAGRYIGSSADDAAGRIETNGRRKRFQYQVPKMHSALDHLSWLRPLAEWRRERARQSFQKELNRFGKISFVRQDVRQWAAWQVDYLKYDWVPIDLPHVVEMSRELRASPRDIVYGVSNNAAFSLAPELARWANAWRTTVDIKDTWASVSDLGFFRDRWAPFNQPGHYNDHDMLVLGRTRWSPPGGCGLTSDEQYTHMSLWCLLSGPLLLGCDLEKLDPFTLGLLTNDEVLAVNQDPLCRQATEVAHSGDGVVYAKPLEDGSWAVGLFNRGPQPRTVTVRWSDLGLTTPLIVRDLWRQKDLGAFPGRFERTVAPHGVVLVRVKAGRR
jgi:alpha-galactosidase